MRKRALLVSLVVTCATVGTAAGSGTIKGTISSADGPVPGAVVMVDAPPEAAAAGAAHVVIDQRNETFVPHVVAVAVGTTVDFPNHDAVLHNVTSSSPAKRFDLGMYAQGETRSVTFDRPGVVAIRCNAHPAMSAFVVVHSSSHVAVTDARGAYTIGGVPAGSYTVRSWHERLAERQTTLTVHDAQVETLDLRLEPRR